MPSCSANLKPREMTTKRCCAQNAIFRLLHLIVWQGLIHGDLEQLAFYFVILKVQLTGSSLALIANNGILTPNKESTEEASR
jgi:hypothetical protein